VEGWHDKMETKHKEILAYASIKAVITTAILFGASVGWYNTTTKLPFLWWFVLSVLIAITSAICASLYLGELSKRGIIKTRRDIIQTHGITWFDHTEILIHGWVYGLLVSAFMFLNILFAINGEQVLVGFATVGGFAYLYMARNEEYKTVGDIGRYFLKGYTYGVGAVVCGAIFMYLSEIFGILLVSCLFIADAAITGVYTYLDLKDWEREQQTQLELARRMCAAELQGSP
jgi:hypothetical protein